MIEEIIEAQTKDRPVNSTAGRVFLVLTGRLTGRFEWHLRERCITTVKYREGESKHKPAAVFSN